MNSVFYTFKTPIFLLYKFANEAIICGIAVIRHGSNVFTGHNRENDRFIISRDSYRVVIINH